MITKALHIAEAFALAMLTLIYGAIYVHAQEDPVEKIASKGSLMSKADKKKISRDRVMSQAKINKAELEQHPLQRTNVGRSNQKNVENTDIDVGKISTNRTILQLHAGNKLLSTNGGITWKNFQSEEKTDIPIPLPSIGEAVWEKNIPVDSSVSVAPNGVTILNDGSILINGGNIGLGYLMKVSATGDRQWVRSYGFKDSLIYIFIGIERAIDTLQFVGLKRTSILFPNVYPYAIKTDHNGVIYSAGHDGDMLDNGANALAPIGMSGYVESGTILLGASDVLGDVFLRKVAYGGKVIWTRSYSRDRDLFLTPLRVMPTSDGGFVILVSRSDSGRVQRAGIIRTNAEGELLWSKQYDTLMGIPTAIVESPSNEFTFTGTITRPGMSIWPISLVHVDAQGQIIWNKVHSAGQITYPSSLVLSPDAGYLIGGYTASISESGTRTLDSTKDYYLLKVDNKGAKIKEWMWGSSGVIEAITQIAPKGSRYILAGYENASTTNRTLYLAEMQDVVASVQDAGELDRRYNLRVYPNPAALSAEACFVLNSRSNVKLTLFDKIGREVRTWSIGERDAGESRVELDVQNIENGAYILRALIGEDFVSQRLLIVK